MKTPDEIKKGLSICCEAEISCRECPYDCSPNSCDGSPGEDAIEYINQLEDRNEKLENALRNLANSSSNAHDAANKVIEHLKSRLAGACGVCAYNFTGDKSCLAHIKQLEARLAQAERERDELLKERCSK